MSSIICENIEKFLLFAIKYSLQNYPLAYGWIQLKDLLKTNKPIIFLTTHSENIKRNCLELLKEFNYKFRVIENNSIEKSDEFIVFRKLFTKE